MKILQKEIHLRARPRGFHLVTSEVISNFPDMKNIKQGLMHLLIKHTSASITLNENADPEVRDDMETIFNALVPEHMSGLRHTYEGMDDMPAHAKSSIIGSSITIPVTNGKPNLGTWQGIYLCEHRNHGGSRKVVATIIGE